MNRQTRKGPHTALVCFVLALLTFAVFSPALNHQFLTYDDQQYVTENAHVQGGLSWAGLAWAFKTFYASNWHPLTWLSHMLDWQIYGAHAAGHHLTNVLLHVANAVLLFLVLREMTGALWRSACVAALFAWHPLHVQSVAWIAERKDVLSGFFWMLTLYAYLRSAECGIRSAECKVPGPKSRVPGPESQTPSAEGEVRSPKSKVQSLESQVLTPHVSRFTFRTLQLAQRHWFWYGLTLAFFALGLLSKPMLVTLPFVLLLLDYWPLGRFRLETQNSQFKTLLSLLIEKIPLFGLAAAGCAVTILAQERSYSLVSIGGLPMGRRLGHAVVSYAHYLSATFVPHHLAAYYPYPEHEGWFETAVAGLLLVLISILVVRVASSKPYLAVGWFWFLGTLVPVIGLVQVGDQAWADRYTYLPLVGLFIMLVWGAAELMVGGASRKLAPLLAIAIGAALLADTLNELRWWKDTRTLFTRALEVTQRNARATVMVGTFLADEGKLDDAIAHYWQALSYRPDDPEAHFFLARAFEQQGRLVAAANEYAQALWYKPLQERTHISLGVLCAKQGLPDQAAAHYRAALAINPESAIAENDLARLLHSQGKLDEAITCYSNALRFDPNLAQAHNNLGVLLLQKGRVAEGAAQLREALRLNPGDAESQYNLATALNQQQQWQPAGDLLEKLAPARSQDANLHYQFALALAHLDKTRDAMSQYAQALLLRPDFPEALDGLSWILATNPSAEIRNPEQALRMSTLACDLTARKQPAMLATLAAAQAENGRFAQAQTIVSEAQKLAAAAGHRDLAARCAVMAEAFKTGKPWREREAVK